MARQAAKKARGIGIKGARGRKIVRSANQVRAGARAARNQTLGEGFASQANAKGLTRKQRNEFADRAMSTMTAKTNG